MRRRPRARARRWLGALGGLLAGLEELSAHTHARARARAAVLVALTAAAAAALAIALSGTGHGTANTAHAHHSRAGEGAASAPTASTDRKGAATNLEPSGESAQIRTLIALHKPVYCGARGGHEVALTFDDGPGVYTRLALRKLRAAGVGATFFLVARNLALVPGAPRSERELGMVGDHTFTHPVLPSLPAAQAKAEIVRAKEAIERASGGPVFLFRPPYEAMDASVESIVHAHALLEILWDVDSQDSLHGDYAEIAHKVIAGLKPGSIVLMHENHGQTIRALPYIFAALRRLHLRAVSIPELLTDDPPSFAQLGAGFTGCGLGTAPKGD